MTPAPVITETPEKLVERLALAGRAAQRELALADDATKAAALRTTACNKGDQQACRALAASDGGAPAPVAVGAADAGVVGKPGDNPTVAECAVRKKTFMDTCKNTCADKLTEKKIKNNQQERLLFCEGGCATQMFNQPIMAPGKNM